MGRILGQTGRGRQRFTFIKHMFRNVSMQIYFLLKRSVGDRYQWRGIIMMLCDQPGVYHTQTKILCLVKLEPIAIPHVQKSECRFYRNVNTRTHTSNCRTYSTTLCHIHFTYSATLYHTYHIAQHCVIYISHIVQHGNIHITYSSTL